MSDGNTASPVSPIPTESEMTSIRSIFDRAANAIVEASKLAVDVAELRKQVEALRNEIETVRASNRWLDEQLVETRKARDEGREELHKTRMELDDTKNQLTRANTAMDNQVHMIDQTQRELADTKAKLTGEIDQLYNELHSQDDQIAKLKADLDKEQAKGKAAQEHLAKVMEVFKPDPVPEVAADPLAGSAISGDAGTGNPGSPIGSGESPAMQGWPNADKPLLQGHPVQEAGETHPEDQPAYKQYGSDRW